MIEVFDSVLVTRISWICPPKRCLLTFIFIHLADCFYPKWFTIEEYYKWYILKRQTVTGSACYKTFHTRGCAACCVRKGLIFLMLWSANLQDRAVFAMCSLKVSWSSKITPRCLTELDGVIVEELSWMVISCCRAGVAGKTRSSVFARLSCRWCSFIHAEMSARQPEIRAATVGSSGQNER